MKVQVFFYRIAKYFGGIAAPLPAGLSPSLRDYRYARYRRVPVTIKKSEIAAAEGDERADAFRRYSQTEGRALSLRLRKIVDPQQKGTHDSRPPFRDAP